MMNAHSASEPAIDINILVVADAEQITLASLALLKTGIQLLSASSVSEAIDSLRQHDIALAILDLQTSEVDCLALAKQIRSSDQIKSVPILLLAAEAVDLEPFLAESADSSAATSSQFIANAEAAVIDFLQKPLDPRTLRSKVQALINFEQQRRRLHQRNAKLERALQLSQKMVSSVTHDLRTPMTAITFSAELLLRKAADDDTKQMVLRIQRSSHLIARMLAQLLDFSRVSSGSLQIYKQPEDLQAVCLTVITGIQRAQPQALIEVECKGPLDGVFDSNCIGQVFSNLILNALQHGQENGPVLIQLDGSDPLRLTTQVTNSGSFCSEVMTELFAPFRPGQSKEASGLGLGLYIVNQFVQAHGGEVQCHPQVDKTMFEFHIPRQGETTSTGVEDHVPISHPAP